jgi:hypothetical protein
VPANLDLHWSHTRKNAYIWRKGLTCLITNASIIALQWLILKCFAETFTMSLNNYNRHQLLGLFAVPITHKFVNDESSLRSRFIDANDIKSNFTGNSTFTFLKFISHIKFYFHAKLQFQGVTK